MARDMSSEMEEHKVRNALRIIVRNQDAPALNWAVNYAKAGCNMSGHELKVQCLYVLSNMSHWRGEDAKLVRQTLKAFTKSH